MISTEIKAEALKELGYTEEPNFDSDDDNAVNAINSCYERVYSLALQEYEWSFSIVKTEVLTPTTQTTGGYKYEFELPDDLLYLRGVFADDSYSNTIDKYERNGKLFYTNSPKLFIEYTKKVCEEELPAYFTEYLIYKLARKLCTRITGDKDLLQEMMMNEQQSFNAAKNSDIKQQQVRILPTGTFVDVRF